jgi:glycosyltransferase involved in cell wall biosynthesis
VVHVHNLFPNFGRRWIEDVRVPVVATMHNFRFACSNGLLFRDGHICTDCPDGRRWSGVRHRCYRDSYAASLPLTIALRRGPTADPLLARADRILCLSRRQRAMLEAGGIERERLVEWTNFLPETLRAGPQPTDVPGSNRDGFLFVGRLVPEKGGLDLVRNWPADRVLRIVGDGPQIDEVRQAATGRCVEVLGRISRAEVIELMSRSQALVMPSLWPEGANAPLVFMEALACGLPTVVVRACDVAEQVEREGVGAVVDKVRDMPTAAVRIADDTSQADRCRTLFAHRFAAEVWIARIIELYTSLAAHP